MNSHLALKKFSFCVADLRNNLLLRAIRRLESVFSEYNLLRPELIRGSIIITANLPAFQQCEKVKPV